MIRRRLLILLAVIFISSAGYSQSSGEGYPWQLAKEIFAKEYLYLQSYVINDNLSSIYDIQAITNSLLVRAEKEKEYSIIDSLAGIILQGTTTLREVSWYPLNSWKKIDSVYLGRTYRMWLFPKTITIDGNKVSTREEYHLSSSQFLFLAAQVLRIGASLPSGVYPKLDSLMEVFPSILLEHHYRRWIIDTRSFRLSGWGCARGTYNHREFIALKQNRKFRFKPTVCQTLFDSDLMIIAGLAQVLAAHQTDPARVPIPPDDLEVYLSYLREAETILQSRIELRPISVAGSELPGFAFDNGLYRDYSDHRYALYTDTAYPATGMKSPKPTDASWDISHARRFFFVFHSLSQASGKLPLTLPYPLYLQALAHQFYHVVYADTTRMLFANYLNGDNGWYRVGYHGEGSGYPPYSLSQAALEGGWFFLGEYYEPVKTLGNRLWMEFNSDPRYYNHYYGAVYRNRQPVYRNFSAQPAGSERFVLLQWLPGL